jgi:sugar O-acyltransferase (sialic acid O-acetyltransferase NeuD family)
MHVLILGAGGHAQVVADILWRMQEAGADVTPVGYLDDNPALLDQHFLDLPVLGCLADLPNIAHDAVIVGIGDNTTRRGVFRRLQSQGERLIAACHPQAVIAPDVLVGPGSMICAGVVVNPGSHIGANVILNTGCTVDHHNHIADHVHLAPGVHLGGEVTIGEGTFVGIGSTVIPGRTIGAWTMIGAGSVVNKDIPDQVTAVGVPARVMGRRE